MTTTSAACLADEERSSEAEAASTAGGSCGGCERLKVAKWGFIPELPASLLYVGLTDFDEVRRY
jgi:hypothetical protein